MIRTTFLLLLAVAVSAAAAPLSITWSGGDDFAVVSAPKGYETMRYGASFTGNAPVTDGEYELTFRFLEPTVKSAFARVFDVTVNGQTVIPRLDVFARCGFMRPCLVRVPVSVSGGNLTLGFKASVRNAIVTSVSIAPLEPVAEARITALESQLAASQTALADLQQSVKGIDCSTAAGPSFYVRIGSTCLPVITITSSPVADATGKPTSTRESFVTLDTIGSYAPSGWKLACIVLPESQ